MSQPEEQANSCKPSTEKKTGKKTPNFYINTKVAWYSMEIWVHMEEYTREEEHWKGGTDRRNMIYGVIVSPYMCLFMIHVMCSLFHNSLCDGVHSHAMFCLDMAV